LDAGPPQNKKESDTVQCTLDCNHLGGGLEN